MKKEETNQVTPPQTRRAFYLGAKGVVERHIERLSADRDQLVALIAKAEKEMQEEDLGG